MMVPVSAGFCPIPCPAGGRSASELWTAEISGKTMSGRMFSVVERSMMFRHVLHNAHTAASVCGRRPAMILLPAFLAAMFLLPHVCSAQDQPGEAKLDEAIKLRVDARSPADFEKIGDLCEEAIEAGLSEESAATAKQMWAAALLNYAENYAERVFATPPDSRWKFLRQQALDRLEQAVEINPALVDAWLLIARFNLLDGGDREAAQNALTRAFENSTESPAQQTMALVLRAQIAEDADKQLEDLNKALQLSPESEIALALRGEILFAQGKMDEAIADFKKVAELQGNNPTTLIALAEKLIASEKNTEAIAILDQALQMEPDLAAGWLLRGEVHRLQKNNDAAISDLSRAIELEPRNLEALFSRATLYRDMEKYPEALEDVDKFLLFEGGSVRAIQLRAFIHAGMEKFDSAIEDMKLLAENFPQEPGFQMMLGMFYNAADMPSRAIEIYDELLKDDPENQPLLRGRGDAYLSRGQHKEAIADYEAALKLDEDDDGVLNNLAWVLATSPVDELRNGKRAVELALKAVELTENKEAHILSTLAAAYAETGDFENAVKWSEKSVEIASPGRQKTDLTEELETFRSGKPVRESKNVEDKTGEGDENDKSGDAAASPPAETAPEKQDSEPKDDGAPKDDGTPKEDGGKDGVVGRLWSRA
jgi:tetratricopeptide (TPR) repeat protein